MEPDNDIPSLDIRNRADHSPLDRPSNADKWWNDDINNMGCIDPLVPNEDEWNIDLLYQRIQEVPQNEALFWKKTENPSIESNKKPAATRLQDCFILDLDKNNTNNYDQDILPTPNVDGEVSDTVSWPYESVFYTYSYMYSPCRWYCRKRRMEKPSSTMEATKEYTGQLDTRTFQNFSHYPLSSFQVWNHDHIDTSFHTYFDPSISRDAVTPPPVHIRKRKKGWNSTKTIEAKLPEESCIGSPIKRVPVAHDIVNNSCQRSPPPPRLKLLFENNFSIIDGISDDSSHGSTASIKPYRMDDKTEDTPKAIHFRQIIRQKDPITEDDFMARTNRTLFHGLIYEQTMGVTLAALRENQNKKASEPNATKISRNESSSP